MENENGHSETAAAETAERSKSLISMDHIWKTYQMGVEELHALRDVSFKVEKSEYLAIIGPSGSGKSTLTKSHWPFCSLSHERASALMTCTRFSGRGPSGCAEFRARRHGRGAARHAARCRWVERRDPACVCASGKGTAVR